MKDEQTGVNQNDYGFIWYFRAGTKTSKIFFTHEETSEWHDFQRGDLKFNFRVSRKEYHKMIANQCFSNKDVLLI